MVKRYEEEYYEGEYIKEKKIKSGNSVILMEQQQQGLIKMEIYMIEDNSVQVKQTVMDFCKIDMEIVKDGLLLVEIGMMTIYYKKKRFTND